MSAGRRLDRLEARAGREEFAPEDEAAVDAEMEVLIAELEEREGPGAFARMLARIEGEFAAAESRRWRP